MIKLLSILISYQLLVIPCLSAPQKEVHFKWDNKSHVDKILKERFVKPFKIEKYLYNGLVPEYVVLKSEAGLNFSFSLNTEWTVEELKKFLKKGVKYSKIFDNLRTFSESEISDGLENEWHLFIKNKHGDYVPVYLLVRFDNKADQLLANFTVKSVIFIEGFYKK